MLSIHVILKHHVRRRKQMEFSLVNLSSLYSLSPWPSFHMILLGIEYFKLLSEKARKEQATQGNSTATIPGGISKTLRDLI